MSKKNYSPNYLISLLLFFAFILAAGGCGIRDLATGRIAPPEVAFQGLTVYPPESQCWPLSARLQLTNPNPEPLRIIGYDYEFSLEGTDLVQGESVSAITLPAGGQSLVEVPVLLKLPSVPKALKAFLLQNSLNYKISGGFRLASVLGGLRVPFRFQGTITRQEALERLRGFFESRQR